MTQTVWKFPVSLDDVFVVSLPKGAKPLSVQDQAGDVQMWCLCDSDESVYENRAFRLSGTGHPIPQKIIAFVGTFQILGGSLVFHLFEIER